MNDNPYCPPYRPMREVLEPAQVGDWKLAYYDMDADFVRTQQIRGAMNGGEHYREVFDLVPGRYVCLYGGRWKQTPLMSDTPMERRTCLDFVRAARGRVLVGGLGIGMTLVAIAAKPEVSSITVVELSEDIIQLVWPQIDGLPGMGKVVLENADVLSYEPARAAYDTVWLDIWGDISGDNWEQMKALRKRFRPSLKDDTCWMQCWRADDVKRAAAEDRRWGQGQYIQARRTT